MDRGQIEQVIFDAVQQWRDAAVNGRVVLTDDIRIVGGIEGFDSYSGLAATVHVAAELGLDNLGDNIFLGDDSRRALTHKEIVEQVVELTLSVEVN